MEAGSVLTPHPDGNRLPSLEPAPPVAKVNAGKGGWRREARTHSPLVQKQKEKGEPVRSAEPLRAP